MSGMSSEAVVLSLSDWQSSAVMYSVERSEENSDLQRSAVYSESDGMVGSDGYDDAEGVFAIL